MDRTRLVVGSVAAALVLFGSSLMAPGPEPRSAARTMIRVRLTHCELHGDACLDARPWIDADRRPPRRSRDGRSYGECGGLISAVFLDPEPCDRWVRPIRQAAPSS